MESGLIAGPSRVEAVGAVTSTSRGTTLTSNATIGNDGAYTELDAAIAHEYHGFFLRLMRGSTTARYLVSVAVGAGGSEKVVLADLIYDQNNGTSFGRGSNMGGLWVPLHVAQGKRIAAAVHRASAASSVVDILLHGYQCSPRGIPCFRRQTSYGIDLANQRGTAVDPGGTANTLPASFTVLSSSLTNPVKMVYVGINRRDAGLIAADNHWLVNIYRGAASAEKIAIPNLGLCSGSSGDEIDSCFHGPFFVNWPAGARITARAQSSSTATTNRELDVALYAFD